MMARVSKSETFATRLRAALPDAGRILRWVLPLWLIAYLYFIASYIHFGFSWKVLIMWLLFYVASAYVSRVEVRRNETLQEKGFKIRGGILRRF